MARSGQANPLSAIHPFWRLDSAIIEEADWLPILEPSLPKVRSKGNEIHTPATASIAGLIGPKKNKAPPKCSKCGIIGHTIRACK
jgi:hypothetical protein